MQAAVTAVQPACMTREEVAYWRRLNPGDNPCADCETWFAAQMDAQGKCNGTPGYQPRKTRPQSRLDLLEGLPKMTEAELIRAHRRCPCRATAAQDAPEVPWAHWTPEQHAELEERQRRQAAAVLTAEAASKGAVA